MEQFLRILYIFPLHFVLFAAMGACLFRALHVKGQGVSDGILYGYFLYFGLFELICVPAKFVGLQTRQLSLVMLVVMLLSLAGACFWGRDMLRGNGQKAAAWWKRHSWIGLLMLLAVAVQIGITVCYVDGSQDAAYYVGVASTAVESNALERYSVYTGIARKSFAARYVFSAFPFHNAVVSVLTGIATIIQARTIIPAVNVCIANLIYYRIGRRLFGKQDARYADLFVLVVFLVQLTANTLFLPGTFYFCRLYEGKAMIANVALPMTLLMAFSLWEEPENPLYWTGMGLSGLAAVSFSGSGYLAGVLAGVLLIPLLLHHFRKGYIRRAILVEVPVLCWAACYVLAKAGILSLQIR